MLWLHSEVLKSPQLLVNFQPKTFVFLEMLRSLLKNRNLQTMTSVRAQQGWCVEHTRRVPRSWGWCVKQKPVCGMKRPVAMKRSARGSSPWQQTTFSAVTLHRAEQATFEYKFCVFPSEFQTTTMTELPIAALLRIHQHATSHDSTGMCARHRHHGEKIMADKHFEQVWKHRDWINTNSALFAKLLPPVYGLGQQANTKP